MALIRVLALFISLALVISGVSAASQDARGVEPKLEWNKPIPFLGPQRTLVLMVEFPDVRMRASTQKIEAMVNVVDDFVRASSYGKAWLEYYIYPKVITLPRNMAYYGRPSPGAQRGDDPSRTLELMYQAIKFFKERSGLDITNFKHVMIVHAGGDEATGGSPNDIWSHCVMSKAIHLLGERHGLEAVYEELKRLGPEYRMLAEVMMHEKPDGGIHLIAGVETVAEENLPSVMIHEFIHSMWIYDLYVYSKDGYWAGSEVGVWTNMDAGLLLDPPVDLDGWSKYLLGWIEAVEVKDDGIYVIHTLDKAEEPHGLIIPVNDEEYYFVHARRPAGLDAALPGPGVIMFKVNKYRPRNVEGEPYMVSVFDANPETPAECRRLDRLRVRLCETLDAPYYDGRHYRGKWSGLSRIGSISINLLNDEVLTEEGFYLKVIDFNVSRGTAAVYVSLEGRKLDEEETGPAVAALTVTMTLTGQHVETAYTRINTRGTVTRSVVVTVTVSPPPRSETMSDYVSVIVALLSAIMALALLASRIRT